MPFILFLVLSSLGDLKGFEIGLVNFDESLGAIKVSYDAVTLRHNLIDRIRPLITRRGHINLFYEILIYHAV